MTPGEIITSLIEHYLSQGGSDTNVGLVRARVREALEETVEEVWNHGGVRWGFKYTNTTLTLAADARSTSAPSDFQQIGEGGGLYYDDYQSGPLTYRHPNILNQLWELNNATTGRPWNYTIQGLNSSTLYQTILFDLTADAAYTLKLYYEVGRPLVFDTPQRVTAAAGSSGVLTGTYKYRATYVIDDLYESDGGLISAPLTVSAKQINLTTVTAGASSGNYVNGATNVTARKIYRTTNGGSEFKLLTTLSDATTTTYTDNTADWSLGLALGTTYSLNRIPAHYHRSVLRMGTLAKLAVTQGDERDFDTPYRAALAKMKAEHHSGLETEDRIGEIGPAMYGMH